jgi:hypothetical protein
MDAQERQSQPFLADHAFHHGLAAPFFSHLSPRLATLSPLSRYF